MEQLLKITTIPMQYELKVTNAKLEYQSSNPSLTISRDKGGLTMKSRGAKLNLDTFEAKNSVVPTTARMITQTAKKGTEAAQTATAQYAQEGQLLLKPNAGDALGTIISQRNQLPTGEFKLAFIPSAPVDKQYQAGDLETNYQMDRLHFDLKIQSGNFEFIAGSIEMSITQYPDISIEYIGGHLYVPPSADPNYEPLDVRA